MPQTGEDLANQALSSIQAETDEVSKKDKIAQTLYALQGVI